ncbi:hypothetical protein SAMN05192573_102537 [Mucilaginibacter gossypii]|uniref:Uncharacterized protein n=1 Tax=Mucilaginibacter gossypii TaxID=551996 RepID=A0A1G7SF28_9SPHI|nr:hypothetical protein SAMN05192573_102537 [Mucilaginibacter gossypii]
MDFQKKEHRAFFIFFSGIKKLGHLICYNAPGHKGACSLFEKRKRGSNLHQALPLFCISKPFNTDD